VSLFTCYFNSILCLHRSVKNTQDTNYMYLLNSHRLPLKKLNRVTCEARFIDQMSAIHASSAQNVIKIFSKFFTRIRSNRKRILIIAKQIGIERFRIQRS